MKGIVFTELLEMMEQKHGYALVDQIIEHTDLASGGAYTAVGTYSADEFGQLVQAYSEYTQVSLSTLLIDFGHHLFTVFVSNYPAFFNNCSTAFQLLESIEETIHVEVLKLYPDAELPQFITRQLTDNSLEMIYYSDRRMSALAQGLIEATLQYYDEAATIQLDWLDQEGKNVRFLITRAV